MSDHDDKRTPPEAEQQEQTTAKKVAAHQRGEHSGLRPGRRRRLTPEQEEILAHREVEELYEKSLRMQALGEGLDETSTPLDELSLIDLPISDVALAGQKALRGTSLDDDDDELPIGRHIPTRTERHEVLEGVEEMEQAARVKGNSVILDTVVSWVVYIILVFAIYLYWTGHNAPGGGFIAGLMTAAVVVLMYVAFGSKFIRNTMKFDFKYLIGVGLACSLGCGLGGMLFGDPFLTHTFGHFDLGALGEIELATAAIFDLGVYLTVTGGCVTIITSIGESGSRRSVIHVSEEAREVAEGDSSLDT